ncbi:uncharacterized protein CXorf65 homolog [Aricia agestis]|uniref:uncharacterized protein CXorf65 homolog n=1 Tax=Aricia agestis TaxID=91739 RepID=UPI001C20513C|nr:uncharacterized protein CXorf65 homolog [Aricia agestis]
MFIRIIYLDPPELSSNRVEDSEERVLLVNPKCLVRIMLEYIRSRCNLGLYTWFDLCDESGAVMGLFDMPSYEYPTEKFQNGGTYYVIVIKQEKTKQIFPQVNNSNPLHAELKERVRRFLDGRHSATSISKVKA